MKKYNFLLTSVKVSFLFLLALNLSSCDNCTDTDCFTPAEPFYFQLIDKETNQNLIDNGTYSLSDIKIKSVLENKFYTPQLDSVLIEGQKQTILVDQQMGWKTESKEYILIVNDSIEFDFIYQTREKSEDCCTFYEVEEVSSSEIEITKTILSNGFLYKLAL
ncbi:hypothetical protein V9L05_00415 [Bernardetia sp. Wsw4-3y2]|uniref:hypothetical protein n=1 Tax=Bernardetia sp. Wsw4-3y2 TaxID=3127471 RepID=UPI0030D0EC6E